MHTESEPGFADRHPLIWTLGNLLAFQACWWTLILTGPRSAWSVSYTHLTLPTIYSV